MAEGSTIKWVFGGLIALYVINQVADLFGGGKPDYPLPDDPLPLPFPGAPMTASQIMAADKVAKTMRDVMQGPQILPAQIQIRHAVLKSYSEITSGNAFVYIYNRFNELYGGGEDLRQWIIDERNFSDIIEHTIITRIAAYRKKAGMSGVIGHGNSLGDCVDRVEESLRTIAYNF